MTGPWSAKCRRTLRGDHNISCVHPTAARVHTTSSPHTQGRAAIQNRLRVQTTITLHRRRTPSLGTRHHRCTTKKRVRAGKETNPTKPPRHPDETSTQSAKQPEVQKNRPHLQQQPLEMNSSDPDIGDNRRHIRKDDPAPTAPAGTKPKDADREA